MGQAQIVRYDRAMRCMLTSDLHKVGRAIRGDDEYIGINDQVLAIATAYVESDRAMRKMVEEALDNWPGLVASRREV